MVYYLDKAPRIQEMIKKLNMTPAQVNLMLQFGHACRPLRSNSLIDNLMKHCITDNMQMEGIEKEGFRGKKYTAFNVVSTDPSVKTETIDLSDNEEGA
jgi:hypothetical protein